MSIWPQAMSCFLPSRDSDLVSPVIACLVAVYGAEFGRGACAEIEPLLMILPPAGRLRLHLPERRLRAQERAGEVDVDDALPLLERQVLERPADADPGVVEQQVDAAERALRRAEQRVHRRRVRDVGRHRDRARGVVAGADDRLVQRLLPPARERDAPAVAQQRDGDGLADAGAGAGDDGDLA
jgi:hypothetical protein